jgi:hypothetical protein
MSGAPTSSLRYRETTAIPWRFSAKISPTMLASMLPLLSGIRGEEIARPPDFTETVIAPIFGFLSSDMLAKQPFEKGKRVISNTLLSTMHSEESSRFFSVSELDNVSTSLQLPSRVVWTGKSICFRYDTLCISRRCTQWLHTERIGRNRKPVRRQ